jgi:phosphatidylinositol glycan class B
MIASPPPLTARTLRWAFAAIVLLGLGARLLAWQTESGIHSDEFFQVLEPAWWHLSGFGLSAWEWGEGVRSWVLPGYHGAWMALLMSLGLQRGPTLGLLMQLHWALMNLLLIGAAYRGGTLIAGRLTATASAQQLGGLGAALLCALFPLVVAYAPHTLSEMPSMLCFVWGALLMAEVPTHREAGDPAARRRVFVAGLLLSLGACIRIANGPLALVAPLVLVARRRWSLLPWLLLGALLPVLAFGLVDLWTWGGFLGSFYRYLKFNLIEGRAAFFGTSPWHWYLQVLWSRAPVGLLLLVAASLAGLRATWPFLLPGFGLLLLLSTQGHKEERFVIAVWPFLLIAAGGVAGALLARPRRRSLTLPVGAAIALAFVVIVADGLLHVHGGPGDKDRFERAWMQAQAIAGDDPLGTGLVMDRTFYSGGALWYGGHGPQLNYEPALLLNPIISHALVFAGSDHERQAREAGFTAIFAREGVVLLRRH